MPIAVLFVFISILCVLLYRDTWKPTGFPPGPTWLPVLGNYMLVRKLRSSLGFYHLVWSALARRYGPVVGLRLGRDRIVLVTGRQAVQDVLGREEFDGRPDGFFFRLRTFGERLGIVFTDGPIWQEQRRFCLRHLRKYGFGQRCMDEHIETEAVALITSLRERCHKPVPMSDAFDICVLNSLWSMIAGERFDLDDARLAQLLEIVHESFRMLDMSGGLLNQMPFVRHFAPGGSGYSQLIGILSRMWGFLEDTIAEHRKVHIPEVSRDLIDSFLSEMKTNKSSGSTFTYNQLMSLCLDLFMAGSETTSNTLGFAVLYAMLHPAAQLRAQAELDVAVGRDRQPMFRDRLHTPYVEAMLMEVQRIASIAPVAVAHRAVKDTVLQGHFIPEGCTLLVSIWSVHMDDNHWGDPHTFRPERFLDANGKLLQDDWFIPYGTGKRRCLGETLAKSSLFVFFASILQNFTIELPSGYPVPTTDGFDGVTLSPKPFLAQLTPRT